MNFQEMTEVTKALCEQKGIMDMSNWAFSDFTERIGRSSQRGWETIDIAAPDCDVQSFVPYLYKGFRETLEMIGMSVSNGSATHDEVLWEELTEVLATFREVLVNNYHLELPAARVVSMVEEVIEAGVVEQVEGENGEKCVRLKIRSCDLKIRITQIPAGPAPEEIRQKWVGLVLPAFKPTGHPGCYAVPMVNGLQVLEQVSPEGVDWFANNFDCSGDFHFKQTDAEVVAESA